MRRAWARAGTAWCLVGIAALAHGACAEEPPPEEPRTDAATHGLLTEAPAVAPQAAIDPGPLGFDRGRSDAPVRVIELTDYACGYCRQFRFETWPTIRDEFVETGKVSWKVLPFVGGSFPSSPAALVAAECVLEQSPSLFEALDARLWEDQQEWSGAPEPAAVVRVWAGEIGADLARYDSCTAESRRGDRILAASTFSRQIGVSATPAFMIVGYPPFQGMLPPDAFRQILADVYATAIGAPSGLPG